MASDKKADDENEAEDEILRCMLKTPPQPKEAKERVVNLQKQREDK